MENKYQLKCIVCETQTEVIVQDESEKPCFCPMCGFQLESEEIDDE